MPLQAGDWAANVGGTQMQFKISGVDPQGNVTALFVFAGLEAPGFWDEDSQRLTLLRSTQLFVGYLFTDPVNLTGVSGSVVFTLAGVVEDLPGAWGPAPTAKRSAFGWYAQIGVD